MSNPALDNAIVLTAQTLTAWRERMGYSKAEAAREVGCSRNAWAAWEDGKSPVPRYIGLACAALALGMSQYGAPMSEKEMSS